jgi:hypothetical protein
MRARETDAGPSDCALEVAADISVAGLPTTSEITPCARDR